MNWKTQRIERFILNQTKVGSKYFVRCSYGAGKNPNCVHEYINKHRINKNNDDTLKDELETDAIST